jgi:hypothetical protein
MFNIRWFAGSPFRALFLEQRNRSKTTGIGLDVMKPRSCISSQREHPLALVWPDMNGQIGRVPIGNLDSTQPELVPLVPGEAANVGIINWVQDDVHRKHSVVECQSPPHLPGPLVSIVARNPKMGPRSSVAICSVAASG